MNLTVLHAHKPGSNTELPISKKKYSEGNLGQVKL